MEKGVCPRCGESEQVQRSMDNNTFEKMVEVIILDKE